MFREINQSLIIKQNSEETFWKEENKFILLKKEYQKKFKRILRRKFHSQINNGKKYFLCKISSSKWKFLVGVGNNYLEALIRANQNLESILLEKKISKKIKFKGTIKKRGSFRRARRIF